MGESAGVRRSGRGLQDEGVPRSGERNERKENEIRNLSVFAGVWPGLRSGVSLRSRTVYKQGEREREKNVAARSSG